MHELVQVCLMRVSAKIRFSSVQLLRNMGSSESSLPDTMSHKAPPNSKQFVLPDLELFNEIDEIVKDTADPNTVRFVAFDTKLVG